MTTPLQVPEHFLAADTIVACTVIVLLLTISAVQFVRRYRVHTRSVTGQPSGLFATSTKKTMILAMAAYFAVFQSAGVWLIFRWFWSDIERQSGISLTDFLGHRPWVSAGLALLAVCWLVLAGAFIGWVVWRIGARGPGHPANTRPTLPAA